MDAVAGSRGVLRRLGRVLGASWAILGASCSVLGSSWSVLERLGGVLERLGRVFKRPERIMLPAVPGPELCCAPGGALLCAEERSL